MKSVFYSFIIVITIFPALIYTQSRHPKPETPTRTHRDNLNENTDTENRNSGAVTKTREQKMRLQKPIGSQSEKEVKVVERKLPIVKVKNIQPIQPAVERITYIELKPENKIAGICGGGSIFPVNEPNINEPLTDLEYYDLEIKNFPQDTVLYFLRGVVKTKLEDYSGATKDFTIYLKAYPKDEEAYYQRGLAYLFDLDRNNAFLDFQFSYYLGSEKSEKILKKYF